MLAELPGMVELFAEWWPVLVMIAAAAGAFYRVFKNGMRNMLSDIVDNEIKPIQEQFRNNGGSTLKDAVDRMAVGLQESNQKADAGLGMATDTNERVLAVAADTAAKVDATNERVREAFEEIKQTTASNRDEWTSSIQNVQSKLDETAVQMHAAAAQRAAEARLATEKLNSIVEKITADASRIETVTANLAAPYFEVDANIKTTYVNDAFLKLMGMSLNEAMAADLNDYVAPEDLSRVQRTAVAALESKSDWIVDYTIITKDKRRVKIMVHAHPVWDGEKFGGYTGAYTVIDK